MKKQMHRKRNHENSRVGDVCELFVVTLGLEWRGFGGGEVSVMVAGVKCKSEISRGIVFQKCSGMGVSTPIPSFFANGRDGNVVENLCMAFN